MNISIVHLGPLNTMYAKVEYDQDGYRLIRLLIHLAICKQVSGLRMYTTGKAETNKPPVYAVAPGTYFDLDLFNGLQALYQNIELNAYSVDSTPLYLLYPYLNCLLNHALDMDFDALTEEEYNLLSNCIQQMSGTCLSMEAKLRDLHPNEELTVNNVKGAHFFNEPNSSITEVSSKVVEEENEAILSDVIDVVKSVADVVEQEDLDIEDAKLLEEDYNEAVREGYIREEK